VLRICFSDCFKVVASFDLSTFSVHYKEIFGYFSSEYSGPLLLLNQCCIWILLAG